MSVGDGELETATEMAQAVRSGQATAGELLDRARRRAEAWQPHVNAFSQLWEDNAPELHGWERAGEDAPRGVAGVPVAIKDLFDVAGRQTTGCCAAYRGNVATVDAPAVARLRAAGATFVGKTNQHELAAGGTNAVSACGPTGNPWNPSHITGGSSGGSGAAVAAGIVPWALGSDTGGSIRIPASMCGAFGLKPTTGSLSIRGMLPLAPSLDCPGPIASTATDLWTLFRLMSWGELDVEEPPADAQSVRGAGGARAVRIGLPDGLFVDRVHPEVLGVVAGAGIVLEGAGIEVEHVDGRGIEDARRVWMRVCTPEFFEAHRRLQDRRGDVAPSVLAWLDEGEALSAEERSGAARRRAEIAGWFEARLAGRDALLIPTTPYAAPRLDQERVDMGAAGTVDVSVVGPGWLTCSVNLAGLPAVNLPAGRSTAGMPIGATLVGPAGGEAGLLRLALLWEAASGYRPRPATVPGT